MSSEWTTIESDPGVFTSLIESFGVKNVEVTELWSLDDDSLQNLNLCHGLIFLFKWDATMESTDPRTAASDGAGNGTQNENGMYFAKQVIQNACATQAIINILMNVSHPSVTLGSTLSDMKEFTAAFDSEMKGEAIGNSDAIREAHNEFGRKDDFLREHDPSVKSGSSEEVFHFVAYLPYEGQVYELDGLKPNPILIGDFNNNSDNDHHTRSINWLKIARGAVQDRMERYAASEVKFALMGLVQDQRTVLQEKIEVYDAAGQVDDVAAAQVDLEMEQQKREMWSKENARRKHNYLPLCMEFLKALASSGKLPDLTKKISAKLSESSAAAATSSQASKRQKVDTDDVKKE